jgi:hypothetical protein
VRCSMSQMNVKNDTVVEEAQVSPASRRRLFAETEGGEATQQPSAAADEQLDAWERQARENTTEQASTRPHSRSHRPRSVRPSLLECVGNGGCSCRCIAPHQRVKTLNAYHPHTECRCGVVSNPLQAAPWSRPARCVTLSRT